MRLLHLQFQVFQRASVSTIDFLNTSNELLLDVYAHTLDHDGAAHKNEKIILMEELLKLPRLQMVARMTHAVIS